MMNTAINGRIRAFMERRHMKQTALAQMLGMDYQTVHRVVCGRRKLYADEILAFCRALEVSPAELLGL